MTHLHQSLPISRYLFLGSAFTLFAFAVSAQTPGSSPLPLEAATPAPPPTLTIDLSKPGTKVSPTLYGLMTEEINYSYEGGLYGELIQNRIFRDNAKDPVHWSVVQENGGANLISLDESQKIEGTVLHTSLKLDASQASPGHRVGIANDGYWGIPVKPKTTYRASFYAKSDGSGNGPLTVSIEDKVGAKVFATAHVPAITGNWQQYTATLTTGDDVTPISAARFVISTEKPGTLWFNLVSLFPPTYNDRPNGNRIDIMQLLSNMKPTFLRLPGGNFLEGDTIADRFPWKQTIGPLAQRPGHKGCWHYGASDGMGLLEFLEWCEDLHIEPVLAVYAGYSLRQEHVDAGPALQPFVDDALDEIEYVTGDASTKWGAERMKDGHPAPFPLTYVEIGNEDTADKSHSYEGRFAQFYDAIKAKYPNLKCIDTLGPKYWDKYVAKVQRTGDLIDEHYYRNAWEMENDAAHYDKYDRKGPKIFVGEWATREGQPTTNMNAALGDAAWMTGMERNSDLVVMASYAPLFVNVNPGGMQWKSDLIGYDTLTSYGSPSYYAQKMFNNYLGDTVVQTTLENTPNRTWQPPTPKDRPVAASKQVPSLFQVVTRDSAKGTIYLKIVNTAGNPQIVNINLKGVDSIAPEGTLVVLRSARPEDTNSITEPTNIVPVTSKINGVGTSFTHTFAPYSINVLQIETR
ncbi:MAG: alpha-L-arabinofuranosidase C-terminal domain-containing protein [Chthoniobacteraceae bacterium]